MCLDGRDWCFESKLGRKVDKYGEKREFRGSVEREGL